MRFEKYFDGFAVQDVVRPRHAKPVTNSHIIIGICSILSTDTALGSFRQDPATLRR
jgi:hypothetical protein